MALGPPAQLRSFSPPRVPVFLREPFLHVARDSGHQDFSRDALPVCLGLKSKGSHSLSKRNLGRGGGTCHPEPVTMARRVVLQWSSLVTCWRGAGPHPGQPQLDHTALGGLSPGHTDAQPTGGGVGGEVNEWLPDTFRRSNWQDWQVLGEGGV